MLSSARFRRCSSHASDLKRLNVSTCQRTRYHRSMSDAEQTPNGEQPQMFRWRGQNELKCPVNPMRWQI